MAGDTGIGLETVKLLKDMGSWAYMLPSADVLTKLLEDLNVVVAKGDLSDTGKLKSLIAGVMLADFVSFVCN